MAQQRGPPPLKVRACGTEGKGKENFEVVLLGEGSVGKTSIARRYVEHVFDQDVLRTLNASYLERTVRRGQERNV